MRIIIDAMGGDNAPREVVRGAVEFALEYRTAVMLVGIPVDVTHELRVYDVSEELVQLAEARSVIDPDEPPVAAVRNKPDSSIMVGLELLKRGEGDAFVSAGSTGALMAGGLLKLNRIPGIDRPAIANVMPTRRGRGCLVLDLGAGVDAKPMNLYQFAVMGTIYSRAIFGIERPRVGLLNVGTEETKGNEVVKKAYEFLSNSNIVNFVGNVEGRDISTGNVDVVVCDGFVGNILLKYAEGMMETFFQLLRDALDDDFRSKVGGMLVKPALQKLIKKFDYTEYGGAPLLGLKGVVIKCHGSSNAKAIKHGARVAKELVEGRFVSVIEESLGSSSLDVAKERPERGDS